uniref:Uncharacterized protein n=1 Tax=Sphaeramia orbicularis TaxID=375764 RepID=A0A672ZGC3_9TELE
MARKRSAQEGVQGAPVNKRKSLLMKPRHYSPNEACEEESEDLAPPQDKEELRNIDTPAGKQMSCCFVCFDEQLTLNFKIPSVTFVEKLHRTNNSYSVNECFLVISDGNLNAINGVGSRNGDSLGWSEVTSNGSQCEGETSEPMIDEDDEALLNNEEEDQSQERMSGASSPHSPYRDMREADWEPLSLSAKVNGSSLEMSRGRVNFSLLEQAIALQTEQRQVLHHAYREMDRFLLEQMTNERRHQRMMDMDGRLNYHSGKGKDKDPDVLIIITQRFKDRFKKVVQSMHPV